MKKISLLLVFVCVVASLLAKENQPNILFILVDDLGYSDVGYMDLKEGINTPNIDQLANEGMVT